MSKVPSHKELQAVAALDGPQRYAHTVKRAADGALLWGLYDGGWVSSADETGEPAFPVWPRSEYAALCAVDAWAGSTPRQIPVHDFLEEIVPNLVEGGSKVAVFATAAGSVMLVPAEQFARDLIDELSRLE